MKLLVTGSKGFIGQNFLNQIPNSWQVSTFDIKDDISVRPKDLDVNVDWVVHLGAISSTTEKDVQKIMDMNLSWSIELVDECIKTNANIQWSSSASIYGRQKKQVPMKEDIELNPLNNYAMSKYLLEQYVKIKFPKIVWQGFRYFNVYGPLEKHKGNQASPYTQFEKQAKETGVIRVFENSDNYVRDFIHVDDVIECHLRMMNTEQSGIFNLGSGKTKSFLEVANEVSGIYGAKIEFVQFPDNLKDHYQYYTCANMNLVNSILKDYER